MRKFGSESGGMIAAVKARALVFVGVVLLMSEKEKLRF